jgi:hypothetical protein
MQWGERSRINSLNSVDTSTVLEITFSWYRLICSNGMMFGLKDSQLRRRHIQSLDPEDIARYLKEQLDQLPKERMVEPVLHPSSSPRLGKPCARSQPDPCEITTRLIISIAVSSRSTHLRATSSTATTSKMLGGGHHRHRRVSPPRRIRRRAGTHRQASLQQVSAAETQPAGSVVQVVAVKRDRSNRSVLGTTRDAAVAREGRRPQSSESDQPMCQAAQARGLCPGREIVWCATCVSRV